MNGPDRAPGEAEFEYRLSCPCGVILSGATEDEIVDISFEHLREHHPDLADTYAREHILFMALRLRR